VSGRPPDPSDRRPARRRALRVGAVSVDPESTAAGIYGVIVCCAVLASASAPTAVGLAATALATLIVYWGAERYARLVAERIHDGRWRLRHHLMDGWEMVTASLLPLLTLLGLPVLGLSQRTAVIGALACGTVLLGLTGWEFGAGGRLRRRERLASAAVAALFGLLMIGLKAH